MPSEKAKKKYYKKNRKACIEKARQRRLSDPELFHKQRRASQLRIRYGITQNDYEEILKKQNNCCGICKNGNTYIGNGKTNRYFDIDHDHKRRKVRGLLCRKCNILIGHLESLIENKALKTAIDNYLGRV